MEKTHEKGDDQSQAGLFFMQIPFTALLSSMKF